MKKIIVLGIETSCDETSVSVVEKSGTGRIKILSNIVRSQLDIHRDFGGVVPELAARAHSEIIDKICSFAMKKAKVKFNDLNAIIEPVRDRYFDLLQKPDYLNDVLDHGSSKVTPIAKELLEKVRDLVGIKKIS